MRRAYGFGSPSSPTREEEVKNTMHIQNRNMKVDQNAPKHERKMRQRLRFLRNSDKKHPRKSSPISRYKLLLKQISKIIVIYDFKKKK